MKNELISIISIVLGIIMIIFPALNYINSNTAIIGLSLLLMTIYLFIIGISESEYNLIKSILNTIIGFILLIISISIMFNQNLISSIIGIKQYIVGIFLIIIGLISIIGNRDNKYGFYSGIIGIILGLIYIIIVVTNLANPLFLGFLTGVWLLICGVLNFLDRY
ncbi:hypothetical protein BGI41_06720 [Methanobrevibacter sp. 87.7]|uniref:hypothetical protein n=1 Tax=Methanobrevibacter sp. 87.7 TaxID=387957 RepID=UPI000B50B6E1|nr:hypothetical protein [Methanobrevibacter sp. 87.7]OWT32618.1 hypothetical protein BGI41_06720 [Methanobrevibacter sp. 87.7]